MVLGIKIIGGAAVNDDIFKVWVTLILDAANRVIKRRPLIKGWRDDGYYGVSRQNIIFLEI